MPYLQQPRSLRRSVQQPRESGAAERPASDHFEADLSSLVDVSRLQTTSGYSTVESAKDRTAMSRPLNQAQKDAIATFRSLTMTDESVAIACLSQVQYSNLENAIDHYYNHQHHYDTLPAAPQQNPLKRGREENGKKVKALFDKYANDPADNLPDKIGPNGVMRLLNDLGLDAEDRKVLILAYKMGAEVMCEFSWAEWSKGMQDMQVDSVNSLRRRLNEIDQGLKESDQFKPLYQFTFAYGRSAGQRNLALSTAVIYWKILFKDQFALLPLWEQFMTEVGKPVTKDTWNLLFEFLRTVEEDLSNYNEEEAWPVVLDKFVTWARPRVNGEEMQS